MIDCPPVYGDRWFESGSLQRTVRLSPGAAVESREPRLSARLCAAGLATGSAETRGALQDRANRRQYLCGAIFQYRSAADGFGANATPATIKAGRSPSLIVRWISALGPGSTKAQHDPLIVPGKRQAWVREELLRRQIARLPPIEDRLGDIGAR